jgi:hypothetical protein
MLILVLVGLPPKSVVVSADNPLAVAGYTSYTSVGMTTKLAWLIATPAIRERVTRGMRGGYWLSSNANTQSRKKYEKGCGDQHSRWD